MTYKEIVDLLGNIAGSHKMIADWGYGDLSDIKTRSEIGSDASYPYLFINPAGGVRNTTTLSWTFNLIMMEVVGQDDDFLEVQSNCAQYLNDILAHLELYYTTPQTPQPVLSGVTYSPFKERFQDELAGMTLSISFILPRPLNDCITPFA